MAKRKSRIPRLGSKARPRLYGTGDSLDYLPFNPDQRPRNKKVLRIFNDLGYISWRDIFINPNDIAYMTSGMSGYRRGHVFLTPNEAIAYGTEHGSNLMATGLMRIYYDPNTNTYHVYVLDSS